MYLIVETPAYVFSTIQLFSDKISVLIRGYFSRNHPKLLAIHISLWLISFNCTTITLNNKYLLQLFAGKFFSQILDSKHLLVLNCSFILGVVNFNDIHCSFPLKQKFKILIPAKICDSKVYNF